ncbi:hypothetical protein N7493_010293 [Penicillium malachiteum]|uniref:Thioesterase domain-containing protein n=1 Tax=Penicillium malachiteum TaxID=1324776 RepID=A0AAD6HCW2_9EURO|nr:hypothetical protein N7493_010293 [Penicillium malachiteum]
MAPTPESEVLSDADFEQSLHDYLNRMNDFAQTKSWYPDFNKLEISIENFSQTPNPSVTYRFRVIEELCNNANVLHGGCAVLLVDDLTTVLLGALSKPGLFTRMGASKHLSATLIRPLRQGEEARIVSEIEYSGKNRAVLRAKLYRVESGELCAILENDRANTDPPVKSNL